MNEATKTIRFYPELKKYLNGKKVLDIGAGNDPVCPHATIFDKEQGNAEEIQNYFPPRSFDTVFASHCLEHMTKPIDVLVRWFELVKPGGHLIILIPDEDLYEQGFFPSIFNSDHKNTFTIKQQSTWSNKSISTNLLLKPLIEKDGLIKRLEVQHDNYDFSLIKFPGKIVKQCFKIPKLFWFLFPFLRHLYLVPIDQTREGNLVLAQIMIIVCNQTELNSNGTKK